MVTRWLESDEFGDRFRGTIRVNPDDIAGALREIEKWRDHTRVVQIGVPLQSRELFGKPQFWPLWEAAVDAGLPVAMFSLEMSRWEIGMRLLCGEARVPWDSIRNKRVGAEDWSRIAQAADSLHEAPLFIVDSGNVTLVDIRAKARRLSARRAGLGMIIVDYLQLMSHTRRVDNRQQEIAEISRGLKMLAKELEIPVIAVSQLNRDPERRQDKRPQLSDLRESGAIEQDADVVMFIHREDADPAKKGLADLIVAKHRNGPTDTVPLTSWPHLTQFRNHATAVT